MRFLLYSPLSGRLRKVEYKRQYQTSRSKIGRGRLREVVAYERSSLTRGSKYSDLTLTFGILENWSLRRGGRLREVVTSEDSTVSQK